MLARFVERGLYKIRRLIEGPFAQYERHIGRLLEGFSKQSRVLEIGPSINPVAPKKDGWHVYTVDHLSREELLAKYAHHPHADLSKIEAVDFVWAGGELNLVVPENLHGTFDGAIASHVIEHIPNLLGFFQSISKLLKPDGRLHLAVPDKRFCFDWFRPLSTTGQVLQAHHQKPLSHTPAARYDHSAYGCNEDGEFAWNQKPLGTIALSESNLEVAYAHFVSATSSAKYEDCHTWQFTPASFDLLMLELHVLKQIDLRVEKIYPADGCEFIAQLGKSGPLEMPRDELSAVRLEKLRQIVEELGEQADYQRRAVGKRRYANPYRK